MHTVWWRARDWGRQGLQVSWASSAVGVNNLLEDGCVLKFQIWGWGEFHVCRSADCCVSFHVRWNIFRLCSWSCLFLVKHRGFMIVVFGAMECWHWRRCSENLDLGLFLENSRKFSLKWTENDRPVGHFPSVRYKKYMEMCLKNAKDHTSQWKMENI
jgi:hypothetical protein